MVDMELHNVLNVSRLFERTAELMSTVKDDKIFVHEALKQACSLPKLKLKVWNS